MSERRRRNPAPEQPRPRSEPPASPDERERARSAGLPPAGEEAGQAAADAGEPADDFERLLDAFAEETPEPPTIEGTLLEETLLEEAPEPSSWEGELLEGEIAEEPFLAPRPEPASRPLEEDEALWSKIEFAADEEEPVAPSFRGRPSEERSDEEPSEQPEREDAAEAVSEQEREQVRTLVESALAGLEAQAQAQERAIPHVAVRRGVFAGPNVLSLLSPDLKADYDELDNVFAAFADLAPGQRGFVRIAARAAPDFRAEARAWVQAVKSGVDPTPQPGSRLGALWAWGSYLVRYLIYEATKGSALMRASQPLRPGQSGMAVKKFTASQLDEDERQRLRDAVAKAKDPTHFDVALYVGAIGEAEDAANLERIVEDAAGGYSVYATSHQALAFQETSPLDALKGALPGDRRLVLSSGELAEIARFPDGLTRPDGIRIARSHFRHLQPTNPIVIRDALDPEPGLVPLGVVNPRSEDRIVVGLRNEQLDQHLFMCGRTGSGKALALSTPLPTPTGWTTMGELEPGDVVFDERGKPCRVVRAYEVLHDRPCYELVFSDGSTLVADAEHLWPVEQAPPAADGRRGRLPWAAALERLAHAGAPLALSELAAAGIPESALYASAADLRPRRWRAQTQVRRRGEALLFASRLLPEFDRAELLGALRARAAGEAAPAGRRRAILTSEELRAALAQGGAVSPALPLAGAVECPQAELPIGPYTLGAWLGAGERARARIVCAEAEVRAAIEEEGYAVRACPAGRPGRAAFDLPELEPALRALGLLAGGRTPAQARPPIPERYLRASLAQRWALLEGLMDADGDCASDGSCQFATADEPLAEQVRELCSSLGLLALVRAEPALAGASGERRRYLVSFSAPRAVFRVERKRARQRLLRRPQRRTVVAVRPVPSVPVRCIEVDSPSNLFLVGRSYIPTHNSKLMEWLIFGVAKADYPLVVIDPHGQLSEDILNALIINAPERMDDIVYVDLGDEEWPVAYNPLDVSSYEQIEPTVDSVQQMLERELSLSRDSAPRAVNYAVQALQALCEANLYLRDPETKCTLLHIITFFQDAEFRQAVINFCSNQTVRESFDPDYGLFEQYTDKQRVEIVQPIIRAFQPLGNSPSFAAVFSAGENRLHFTKLITEGKIVIVRLARYAHQAKIGEFIGSLILPYLLGSVAEWGRSRDPITREERGRGCRVFVDEAPTLLGPNSPVERILAEARKYDLGLIFAAQFLDQFDPRVVKETLGNTGSKLALALDPANAKQIALSIDASGSLVKASTISELPNFHFYANVLWPTGGAGLSVSGPFSAACLPPLPSELSAEQIKLRQQVVERSRLLICNRRAEIDAKRRKLNDNIKVALNHVLRERLHAEQVAEEDLPGFGIAGPGSRHPWQV